MPLSSPTPHASDRFRYAATSIIALLLIGILAVVVYRLSTWPDSPAGRVLPVAACDPSQSDCSVDLPDGGRLVLSLQPKPIRPLQSFRVLAAVDGSAAEKAAVEAIEVDFEGTTMKMGDNRYALAPDGHGFSGDAMLPICVTGTMEWTATVWLSTSRQRVAIPFHFVVAGR